MSNGKPYVTLQEIHERLYKIQFRSVYWNHLLQLMKDELAKIYDPSSAVNIRFEDQASIRAAFGMPPFDASRAIVSEGRNDRDYGYDIHRYLKHEVARPLMRGWTEEDLLDLIRKTHSVDEIHRLIDSGMLKVGDDSSLRSADDPPYNPTSDYCENLWADMRIDMMVLICQYLIPQEVILEFN